MLTAAHNRTRGVTTARVFRNCEMLNAGSGHILGAELLVGHRQEDGFCNTSFGLYIVAYSSKPRSERRFGSRWLVTVGSPFRTAAFGLHAWVHFTRIHVAVPICFRGSLLYVASVVPLLEVE